MSENQNEAPSPEEPVIRDRRRIDPETGQARTPGAGEDAVPAQEQGQAPQDSGDALSQAEQILDEAGAAAEAEALPAAGSDREAELLEDLRRLQAEYVNYKRRVDRDRDVAKEQGVLKAVTALLPVLDDLDAARAAGDLEDGPFAAIAAKLMTALEGLGLEREDQEALAGVEFDPVRHEAVMRQPHAEVPADHVVQVFRNGYARDGRVLRAAQVMVSAGQD
ncbi:nucleotide exchange factor GrpE [Micrococcus porci]|uniref:nucleotide exchange factor GrpE n=1 Tax=Micrococcus porci TaxID=2856555 RepID=UPI003CF093E5